LRLALTLAVATPICIQTVPFIANLDDSFLGSAGDGCNVLYGGTVGTDGPGADDMNRSKPKILEEIVGHN
jgi:hypothetical protein